MAHQEIGTPSIEHREPKVPGSPPHKRTKYIEPANNLSVASILDEEKAATPTPSDPPIVAMPHNTINLPPMNASAQGLQVQLLTQAARAPTRGSAHAAGYDLYAAEPTTVPARGKVLVSTAISIAVPQGCYGRVAPRSGLAAKHSIDVGAGVIDADYRGEVKVLLFNLSDVDFQVALGERVAQLVLERIWTPDVVVVDKLDESVRGAGGFGSTGGFGGVHVDFAAT